MNKGGKVYPGRVYKEALGIRVGDIVTTSYDTGPYEVWYIFGPSYVSKGVGDIVVRLWPVMSLTLVEPGEQPRWLSCSPFSYINEVRQEDGHWFTRSDEVFMQRPERYPDLPVDMFRSHPAPPQPYQFQSDVDYYAGDRRVWQCRKCEADFNIDPGSRYGPAFHCGTVADRILLIHRPNENVYLRTLG